MLWFRTYQSYTAGLFRSSQTLAAGHAKSTTAHSCWI